MLRHAPCSLTLDRATSVTADFGPGVTLQVRRDGTGTVDSDPVGIDCGSTCAATFAQGTTVTLTARGGETSSFAGWNKPCSGTGPCTVTLEQNTTLSAVFRPFPVLRVTVTGDEGAGLVTSAPSGMSCSTKCEAAFLSRHHRHADRERHFGPGRRGLGWCVREQSWAHVCGEARPGRHRGERADLRRSRLRK